MMPLFFHLEAHLWLLYALFANGILCALILKRVSAQAKVLLVAPEAVGVVGLFCSLALNAGLFATLQPFGISSEVAPGYLRVGLLVSTMTLLFVLIWLQARSSPNATASYTPMPPRTFSYWPKSAISPAWLSDHMLSTCGIRMFAYGFVALVLFYNGALIEQVSDGWWHLSLANTLANDLGFSGMRAHLLGIEERAYPALWHINLAVLRIVSGQSLPELFNASTPWLAVIKLMAVYLFALALTQSRGTATLSLLLFIMLPGLAASYLRVSAWPSHLSYTAWFFAFFAIFKVFDGVARANSKSALRLAHIKTLVSDNVAALLAVALAALIMFFTHKVELVWLFIAISSYVLCLLSLRSARSVEAGWLPLLRWGAFLLLLSLVLVVAYLLVFGRELASRNWDFLLMYCAPLVLLFLIVGLAWSAQRSSTGRSSYILFGLLVVVFILLIDWRHLASAFYPEIAHPMRAARQWPLQSIGWFGGTLFVPGWHLQLRNGLVPLGLLSIPIAWWLAAYYPRRASWFLASCGTVALLLCVSPYLHTWLREVMDYHSVWRVSIMIFHPLVFALALLMLWRACKPWSIRSVLPASVLAIVCGALVAYSSYHLESVTVVEKRNHGSAQRDWNVHYSQDYVYYDGSFRYSDDFAQLRAWVADDAVVLADLATSYYASAYLRGSVVNVHPHQGRGQVTQWQPYLKRGGLCAATTPMASSELATILAARAQTQTLWYLHNNDRLNKNVRASCESNRAHIVLPFLQRYGERVYKGEHLELWALPLQKLQAPQ